MFAHIGAAAADIPAAWQPDPGAGAPHRLPDARALINWDLSQEISCELVQDWRSREVSKGTNTKWIFHLRHGVKFHDGSEFNADAVLWNMERVRNKDAPQFDSSRRPSSIFVFRC